MNVEELFASVVEKKSVAERAAYLDAACGQNAELRRQVEALLKAHDEAGSFLDAPLFDNGQTIDPPTMAEQPGAEIGPYKLMEQIGEGGFGLVFVAEQQEPVRRRVALKIIKPGMDSREVLARFSAERQALALMDHPNIAKVFDGGSTETGRPYFVMELVRGVPITDYCDQHHLTPRERLDLFVTVCHAVQHAHQKGIIHRDLKPSNVMVTSHDGRPTVKVIDFGVAKAIGQKLTDRTVYTQFTQMIGTPLYMSPEQAEMGGLDIDTRSDIYSLGVLLYELLTGTTPFDRQRLQSAAFDEIRRVIREEEPEKPSTRLSHSGNSKPSVAALRSTEPARLSRLVRGDLDWITMKCLEKDRTRRYETANGLAMDVQRFLADEPVSAGPPSASYRFRKFFRRNRKSVMAATGMLTLLVAGIVGTTWGLLTANAAWMAEAKRADAEEKQRKRAETAEFNITQEWTRAELEKRIALASRDFLLKDLLLQADPVEQADAVQRAGAGTESEENPTIKELLKRAAAAVSPARIESKFPNQPLVQAEVLDTIGLAFRGVGEHAKAIEHLQRARAIRTTAIGPDHLSTLLSTHELGVAYEEAGNVPEAIRLLEDVRERQRKTLGDMHPEFMSTEHSLAGVLRQAGRITEALEIYERTHTGRKKVIGPEHPHTLVTAGNLAVAYAENGKIPKAIELLERVRDAQVRTIGAEHPNTLSTLCNLAAAYHEADQLPDAIRIFEQVRKVETRKLGPEHPSALVTQQNLANAYQDAGRLREAIELFELVRDAQLKNLEADHPSLLNTLSNLASVYQDDGRLEDATRIFERVLAAREKKLGPEHNLTMTTLHNLAGARKESGKLSEAIQLYEKTCDGFRKAFDDKHPRYLVARHSLAMAYLESDRTAEAIAILNDAAPKARQALGETHPKTNAMARDWVFAFETDRQFDKAIATATAWLELERNAELRKDANVATALEMLGNSLIKAGRPIDAEPLLHECAEIRKAKQPDTLALYCVQAIQGAALVGQKKYIEAEPLLLAGYEGMSRKMDKSMMGKVRLAEATQRLIQLYDAVGKSDEAAKWRAKLPKLAPATPKK